MRHRPRWMPSASVLVMCVGMLALTVGIIIQVVRLQGW